MEGIKLFFNHAQNPSTYCKQLMWAQPEFQISTPQGPLLRNCRPPNEEEYLHASLFSPALASLFDVLASKDISLEKTDYYFAQEVAAICYDCENYENYKRNSLRECFRKYFRFGSLLPQDSTSGTQSQSQTPSTDFSILGTSLHASSGSSLQKTNPLLLVLEVKNELGESGEPVQEALAYYLNHITEDHLQTRCPCLLLTLSGPYMISSCIVFTGKGFQMDPLACLPLFPSGHRKASRKEQTTFWKAVKDALVSMDEECSNPTPWQPGFPYPMCYEDEETKESVKFRYQGLLTKKKDLVFLAQTQGKDKKQVTIFLNFFLLFVSSRSIKTSFLFLSSLLSFPFLSFLFP